MNSLRINRLYPTSTLGRFVWRFVWGPISLSFAFVPLLLLNLIQFPSLLLLPFSKQAFRAYNRTVAFLNWGWWAWGVQRIIGLEIEFLGDDVPEGENALVISNHQGMSDIVALISFGLKKRRLGDIKWLAKASLKYVPGLGWGMMFLECVFLNRNWAQDERSVAATFAKYKRENIPIWLVMFPEGTRFTQEKHKASLQFAEKHSETPLQHVLFPRSKGFSAAVHGLRDHVDAVYSTTILYQGKVPSLVALIRGDVKHIRCHVKRTPIGELPYDEKSLRRWLLDDFAQKDALFNS